MQITTKKQKQKETPRVDFSGMETCKILTLALPITLALPNESNCWRWNRL